MTDVSLPLSPLFTADDLRTRAERELALKPKANAFDATRTAERGDHDLNPDAASNTGFEQTAHPAAVLVPIINRLPEATVLFTRRSDDLTVHAGQISFPGGKIEENDDSPLETALRETEEEIGLKRAHIDVLGFLDTYQTGTGFRIAPSVGVVSPQFTLSPDDTEVAEVFEVPLRFLMTAENHQKHSILWRGRERYYYAMPYGERYIWGATAGILRNLFERLYR